MGKLFSLDPVSLPALTVGSWPLIRALALVTLSPSTWRAVNTTANSVTRTVPHMPPSRCTIRDIIADNYKCHNKTLSFPFIWKVFLDLLDRMIESFILKREGLWCCSECDYHSRVRGDMVNHVESRHVSSSVSCELCGVVTKTRKALKMHKFRNHRHNVWTIPVMRLYQFNDYSINI